MERKPAPGVAVGFRIVGVDSPGLLVMGHGGVHLPLSKESIAEITVGHPGIWFFWPATIVRVGTTLARKKTLRSR